MRVLDIINLNKSYKNNKVLNDCTFSINKGEIVGLVGPNGSGKTTIMKAIAGLIEFDSGTIKIKGNTIENNREDYLSKFSCIIETPALYETLSGYNNIEYIRKMNKVPKEKLDEIISFIDIRDKINCKVKTYSLGMKQRLALGIALVTKPELLILDEPTNGLDPSGVADLRNILLELAKSKGISILISSHILSDLDKICDKIVFIKNGSIVSVSDVKSKLEYTYVQLNIDENSNVISIISNYNIVKDVTKINDNKLSIKIENSKVSQLFNNLSKDNIYYTNIEIIKDSIENTYESIYRG